jgi:hypothetical protein
VFRRGTCDKEIWTKSVAFAADAEELISTEALVSEIPEEKKVPAGGGPRRWDGWDVLTGLGGASEPRGSHPERVFCAKDLS